MTDRDYIRQVDALRAPDSLRADIAALPDSPPARRRALSARWLAAAVLTLAVGLGAAMPRLFPDLFTGGELHPPTATTSPTSTAAEAPAIPDGELTELLEAALPEPASASGGVSLLYSTSQSGRTLGVALCRGDRHGSLGSLVFGVFDNASKAPVGDVALHHGDDGELSAWTDNGGVVHLLWTNYTTTMSWDRDCGAGLYLFDRGTLTAVTTWPRGSIVHEHARDMLDPEKSAVFWSDHKAVLNGRSLDIYLRGGREFQFSVRFDASPPPDPEGIVWDGTDVPPVVLEDAKRYVLEQFQFYASSSEGDLSPQYDNWRIETLELAWSGETAQYNAQVYRLVYRLHTTTPEKISPYVGESQDLDSEGWYLLSDPDHTYLLFQEDDRGLHFVDCAMIYRSVPGEEWFARSVGMIISDALRLQESSLSAAMSDEGLTAELAATVTDGGPDDQVTLLHRYQGERRTIGVLKYERSGGGRATHEDYNMILIGALDRATGRPVGEVYRFEGGEYADAAYFVLQAEPFDSYILCTGIYWGQGRAENGTAALFRFDGDQLSKATRIPGAALPTEVLGLLGPDKDGDAAGYDHRLLIAPNGVELFKRNPAFSISASDPLVPRWLFDRYLPLEEDHPESRAVEGVRHYLEEYYRARFGVGDTWETSADYTMLACKRADDYRDAEYPGALAYRVVLRNNLSGEVGSERFFLFDKSYQLLAAYPGTK